MKMSDPWKKKKTSDEDDSDESEEDEDSDDGVDDDSELTILLEHANKKPDIVINRDDMDIIIDAKYYDSISKVMQSSNYQMLGYALAGLVRNEKSVTRDRKIHIAVPVRRVPENEKGDDIDSSEVVETIKEPVVMAENAHYELNFPFTIVEEKNAITLPTLTGLEIEFPGPEVYLKNSAWNAYYSRTSESLKTVLNHSIPKK
jgi:hypothetical protein